MKLKIIIAGGRSFNNYERLKKECDEIIFQYEAIHGKQDIEIVSGGAPGADKLGEQYQRERKYGLRRFPADWSNIDLANAFVKYDKYGRPYNANAGFDRNEDMARYSDILIAFWDKKSRGTKDMLARAKEHGLSIYSVFY